MRSASVNPPLPLPNSYWVVPGRLLAGEYPGAEEKAETVKRLESLRAAGIDYFLDLTEVDELASYRHLLPVGTKYLRHPIADCGVPDGLTYMQMIQTRIRAALSVRRSIYVHCRAGIGRTGVVVGCFLVEQGLEGKPALQQLNVLWRQSARSKSWPQVPQTDLQAQYIQDWPKHRQFPVRKVDG